MVLKIILFLDTVTSLLPLLLEDFLLFWTGKLSEYILFQDNTNMFVIYSSYKL